MKFFPRKNLWRAAFLLALLPLLALAACSGKRKKKTDPSTAKINKYIDVPVKKLYDRAEAMMNKTHRIWLIRRKFHRTAVPREMFQEVTRRPDAGGLRELAEIRIADSYRLERSDTAYAEAIARYKTFNQFHPRHERAEEVQWSLSQSYYLQRSKPGRDQNMGRNAETELHDYRKRFPDGPHSAEAQRQLVELLDTRARHELRVGDFYLGRRAYAAGQKRYAEALKVKPELAATPELEKRKARITAEIAAADILRPKYLAELRHPLKENGEVSKRSRKSLGKLRTLTFDAATVPATAGLCPIEGKDDCLKNFYVEGTRVEKAGDTQLAADYFLAVLGDPLLAGGRVSVWADKSLDGLKSLELDRKSAVCWPGKTGCADRPTPPPPPAAAPESVPPPALPEVMPEAPPPAPSPDSKPVSPQPTAHPPTPGGPIEPPPPPPDS